MAKATRTPADTEPTPPPLPRTIDDVLDPDPAADQIAAEYPDTVQAAFVANEVGQAARRAVQVLRSRGLPPDHIEIEARQILAAATLRRRALARVQIRQHLKAADNLEEIARRPRPEIVGVGAREELRTAIGRANVDAWECGEDADKFAALYMKCHLTLDEIGQAVTYWRARDLGLHEGIDEVWRRDNYRSAQNLDLSTSLRNGARDLAAELDRHPQFGALA